MEEWANTTWPIVFKLAHAGQANVLTSPFATLMNRGCIHVFWTQPSTESPSAGGQTKGSSSVIVPEASPLSIDLLSPNFSVTYALLNSHYCSHWSLIRENNRPVVTEGENMSQSVTAWAQTHDFSSRSPPSDLYTPRAGQFENEHQFGTVCGWIRKLDLPSFIKFCPPKKKLKQEFWASPHQTVTVICLKQRWFSPPECCSSSTRSLLSLSFNYVLLCS